MEGALQPCNLKSTYNYQTFVNKLNNQYGFEQIGEGGFGVILASKGCVIKLIKNIQRCHELKKEMTFYKVIAERWRDDLLGKVPRFNLYNELMEYCHFNLQRIYSPLLEYDDTSKDKTHVGYLLQNGNFKFMKTKLGMREIDETELHFMPRRKIIHFYINHFDTQLKLKSDERGDVMALKSLVETFTEQQVRTFCFAEGQLLAFLLFDCQILPFDIEVVIGCSEEDKMSTLYMLDFNECQFATSLFSTHVSSSALARSPINLLSQQIDLFVSEAARSMYSKDGKFYFPNIKHPYYSDFVEGMLYERDNVDDINAILDTYNKLF